MMTEIPPKETNTTLAPFKEVIEKIFSQSPELSEVSRLVHTNASETDHMSAFDVHSLYMKTLAPYIDIEKAAVDSSRAMPEADELFGIPTVIDLPEGARICSFQNNTVVRLEYDGKMLYLKWPGKARMQSVLDRTPRPMS